MHFQKEGNNLLASETVDKNGIWYGVVKLICSVDDSSEEQFFFVFIESGKCLFWGKDASVFPFCGLRDITGDGYVEKVIESDANNNSNQTYNKLEVYSFRADETKLLLEVHFNFSVSIDPLDFYGAHLKPINNTFELGITKLEKKRQNVYFVWSKEDQRFYAKGPDNEEWEMVFPADNPLLPLEPEK